MSRFQGLDSLEGAIRQLCELGLSSSEQPLKEAIQSIQDQDKRIFLELGLVSRFLDEAGLGGTQTICAAILAQAEFEALSLVQLQVRGTLDAFDSALDASSLIDLNIEFLGKPAFRPGCRLPSIYHLRLLAFSQAWRNSGTLNRLSQAASRLAMLSPLPQVYLKHKSQLIAPASFGVLAFNQQIKHLSPAGWMARLQQAELLAWIGLAALLPNLQAQIAALHQGNGRFRLLIYHPYFHHWGSTSGLHLKTGRKSLQHRLSDLTFRNLLI